MDFLSERYELLTNASPLLDKYEKRIDTVSKIVGDLTDHEAYTLAILLDNTEKQLGKYRRLKNMNDMSYSETVGPFVKHVLNIISVMYTTFELKDLISIQPLTQKIGALYYLTYAYGSDKGNVAAGSSIFNPKAAPVRTGYYSTMIVKSETVAFANSSANSVATLAYFPLIYPDTINIVIPSGPAAGTYTYLSTSGANYILQKNAGGANVGTIVIATGAITLTGVNSGAINATATYSWNSEKFSANAPIPKVTISVAEEEVRAKRRQLLFEIMLDASFDFESQFGGDINASVESAVIQEMQNELAYYVLDEMYAGATGQGNNTYTFDLYPGANPQLDLTQHAQYLAKFLQTISTAIFNNYGRGRGNKIVTGDMLYNFVSVLPDTLWKPVDDLGDPKGPFLAGRLFGKFDVYYNPAYPSNEFIMLYKGSDWWEAPYFMGVYLPLMASKFMLFPDMHGEQGYISMEAHKYIFPLHVVKATVTDSSAGS